MERFPATSLRGGPSTARIDLSGATAAHRDLGALLPDAVVERLRCADLEYPPVEGLCETRRAIARHLGVEPGDVVTTPGATSALSTAILAICEAGDQVVVAVPCFGPVVDLAQALSLDVRRLRLRFDDRYRLCPSALEQVLTPGTRLVVLTSPQNPSGVQVGDGELDAALAVIERICPEALVLVDETHGFGESVGVSAAARSSRIVGCGSLSKSHGLPGLRLGWLVAGDADVREQLILAKINTTMATSVLDELVAVQALAHPLCNEATEHARGTVAAWCHARRDAIDAIAPDAGAMYCLRLRPERFDDVAVAEVFAYLDQHGVAVAPGSWFGEHDRVIRLGLGVEPAALDAGLAIVADALAAAIS